MSENEAGVFITLATIGFFAFLAWIYERPFNLLDEIDKDNE